MVSKNSIVPEEMLSSVVLGENGRPHNGGILDGETIYRFRDGILHAENNTVVERWPHVEFWQNGKLHNTSPREGSTTAETLGSNWEGSHPSN